MTIDVMFYNTFALVITKSLLNHDFSEFCRVRGVRLLYFRRKKNSTSFACRPEHFDRLMEVLIKYVKFNDIDHGILSNRRTQKGDDS